MILYLSRHGAAAHPSPDKPSSLTPKGKSEVSQMAEYLIHQKGFKADSIWHSPKTRAIQTAEIYWKALGNQAIPMEEIKDLSPDGDANQVYQDLLRHKKGDLLLVSHLPFLPDLAGLLLGKTAGAEGLSFPTAGMAAFELKQTIKLLWTLAPGSIP